MTLYRVRAFLAEVEELGYDICIVDCAAGLFGVTADVLNASDGVIVPQQAEPLGVRSVPKMLEALSRMRAVNSQLHVLGVVLTMVHQNLLESRESGDALRSLLPEEMVLNTEIPRDNLFVSASARGLPVGVMEEGEDVLAIFDRLREELDQRMGHLIFSR